MLKKIIPLVTSLVVAGVVLHIGRLIDADAMLINILFIGIMVIGSVLYALHAYKDFKDEWLRYENGIEEKNNVWENVG